MAEAPIRLHGERDDEGAKPRVPQALHPLPSERLKEEQGGGRRAGGKGVVRSLHKAAREGYRARAYMHLQEPKNPK